MTHHRKILSLATLALALALLLLFVLPATARADAGQVHHLGFASDYHMTEGSITTAFGTMPDDVEYVSLIGDMVGSGRNRAPEYESSDILALVQQVFPHLDNTNVSIIWADHDANVHDEGTNIVKCIGGYESGQVYEGLNDDGSTAYVIYAIGYYDMKDGGSVSQNAAAAFKSWVDGIDPTIPVLVLCHVPLQAKRGDNLGALYWDEALNYAATGVEGITSTDVSADIIRNVIYLYGHNHTVSKDEVYFAPGSVMNVQIDSSSETSAYSEPALTASGVSITTMEVEDEEYALEDAELMELAALAASSDEAEETEGDVETTEGPELTTAADGDWPPFDPDNLPSDFPTDFSNGERPSFPMRTAEGVDSNIYYTSLVAGYLKTGSTATLVTIDDENITLTKHSGFGAVGLGVDGVTGNAFEGPATIAQFKHMDDAEYASAAVSAVGEDGAVVQGATFTLYAGDKAIATFTGGEFAIDTQDEELAPYLPAAGESVTWVLKETEAPEGYGPNSIEYEVTVTASAVESLDGRTYLTTLTYEVTVDGADSLRVAHAAVEPEPEPEPKPEPQPKPTPDKPKSEKSSASVQQVRAALPNTGDHNFTHEGLPFAAAVVLVVTGLALRARYSKE